MHCTCVVRFQRDSCGKGQNLAKPAGGSTNDYGCWEEREDSKTSERNFTIQTNFFVVVEPEQVCLVGSFETCTFANEGNGGSIP